MMFGRAALGANVWFTRRLDALLPGELSVSGVADFRDRIIPGLIDDGIEIWDVGGGKRPIVSPDEKARRRLRLVGLDIDRHELDQAPTGSYDARFIADISRADDVLARADLVICRSVLEHVESTRGAFAGLARLARPGGRVAVFVPCRNALFARLNLVFPEKLKQRLLFSFFPEKATTSGFPARYDQCTPSKIFIAAHAAGLEPEYFRPYWNSNYLRPLAPIWLLWRLWTIIAWRIGADDMCEGFTIVFRRH